MQRMTKGNLSEEAAPGAPVGSVHWPWFVVDDPAATQFSLQSSVLQMQAKTVPPSSPVLSSHPISSSREQPLTHCGLSESKVLAILQPFVAGQSNVDSPCSKSEHPC